MSDAREFKDKAGARDLGDPATDLPLTLRVHPDDDPMDPGARRVIRVAGDDPWPWVQVSGVTWTAERGDSPWYEAGAVRWWPYTSMTVAGAAFLPADPHHGLTVEYSDVLASDGTAVGVATCSCGESVGCSRKYDAAEWHREHRRQARNTTAQAAERGDMDVAAFKGGA